ncbi:MAG TPA: exo-alpha-sialidase [Lentisphaeria bacterium]|nr:MAG: hypothetical protein A2X45_00920 [Lentisphaerae bacterium GWF2_50_93]HCE45820.1 exo-alpha-sialidase [Lentisphaeria bacterium]
MKNTCCDNRIRSLLKNIHAPQVVGIQPANSFRDMVQMPDGEIRHYGFKNKKIIYIASRDCGLSWQEFPVPKGCPGACVQSPWSGDWISMLDVHGYADEFFLDADALGLKRGFRIYRSSNGIDGKFTNTLVSEQNHGTVRMPMPLRSRKRWVVPCQYRQKDGKHDLVVFYSDDDGKSWKRVVLGTVPEHEAIPPHLGVRWQNHGIEPSIVELSNGRLWIIIRTSLDNHYQAFSDDGGETWTNPEPSRFYATITMPTFFRMNDGRIILFWCNTTPLPELDHDKQPELNEWERQGLGEDFFTNRDAFHAAISDDEGRTWSGFREVLLNERRNDSDFRTSGGNSDCVDKSVHQSQAFELPEGKVLVSVGQHSKCRRLIIFDPAWLYEKERKDDFHLGLGDWCTFNFVKSIAGNFKGISGHCAYNRRPGAQLMPDPDGESREVLQIARHPDPRLVHEQQGAVWNFPVGKAGEVRVSLRLVKGGQGIRICLMDRFFNPFNSIAHDYAQYSVEIDGTGRVKGTRIVLKKDVWHELVIKWTDSFKKEAKLSFGKKGPMISAPLIFPSGNGISYLHMMSIADSADFSGVLVRSVEAKVNSR